MMIPALLYWAAGFAALLLLLYLINTTGFLHRESAEYRDPDPDRIFDPLARPFEMKGNSRHAVLCLHGFPSTPAMWRRFADIACEAGFDVVVPLLPGCGTAPRDILATSFSQYLAKARDTYLELQKRCDTVSIVGLSMGGLLALRLAEEAADGTIPAPAAVCTAAAPVFLNRLVPYGVTITPAYHLIRMIGWFVPSVGAATVARREPGSGIDGDEAWMGYRGKFPRQIYSLKLGMRKVERNLDRITVPLMVIHAKGDRIVPFANLLHIAARVNSRLLRLRVLDLRDYGHSHHALFLYRSIRDGLSREVTAFLKEAVKEAVADRQRPDPPAEQNATLFSDPGAGPAACQISDPGAGRGAAGTGEEG